MERADIIEEAKSINEDFGGPIRIEEYEEISTYDIADVMRVFGSWYNLKRAADIEIIEGEENREFQVQETNIPRDYDEIISNLEERVMTKEELPPPNPRNQDMRERGVTLFNPLERHEETNVYYIFGHHSAEEIVKRYLEENEWVFEKLDEKSIRNNILSCFTSKQDKEAVSNVIDDFLCS